MNKKFNAKILRRIWQYVARYRLILIIIFFFSVITNLLALVGPFLSGRVIDSIELGKGLVDFDTVYHYCKLMTIFYVVSSINAYFISRIMINLSQKVVKQLRFDLFTKIVDLPIARFNEFTTGDLISRMSFDIDTIATTLATDIIQILNSITIIVGSLVFMFIISPLLVCVFLVTIPISIIMTSYITKKTRPLYRKKAAALGNLNGFAEEFISGHKTIKAYHVESKILDNFQINNDEATNAYYQAEYYGTLVGPSMNFVSNISISLVSFLGIIMFLTRPHMITIGKISTFTQYSRRFSGPINEFANIINELQNALSAAERVFMILDEENETCHDLNTTTLTNVTGHVTVNDVNFGYTKEQLVLKEINFEAKPGQVIAIVGPTGGGKTTIINLLMRFYDPNSGTINVDNQDTTLVTRSSLRQSYSMVLQDTWLFYGTVFENIAYAKPNATIEEVIEVAKAAKIDRFINSLPGKYQYVLDDDGTAISKGQKQLLTIARAMLSDAKMLILDEATSNVDTNTEIKIQKAMINLMTGKTCFVIAHRLSTIINADWILVIKDGRIIEQGQHQTLVNGETFYASLYKAQFE